MTLRQKSMLSMPVSRSAARGCVVVMALWALTSTGPVTAQSLSLGNLDETAGKTCRSILAVINPATTAIELTSTMRIGDANAVVIAYVARPTIGQPKGRKLVCSFKDAGGTFRRTRDLVAVTSDGAPLGPARMRFLQRFWVGSIEAEAAAAKMAAKPKP